MSFWDDLLLFHNLTSLNVNGHFELFIKLSFSNHAWVRTSLGTHDWRADPYASLVNAIRSTQAYYGRVLIAGPDNVYTPTTDFRVDLIAPARPNGQGSQRDCFEYFGVVHRLPADAFGGVGVAGGVVVSTIPYEWHTVGNNAQGVPYMTAAGTARAQAMRACYPQNGYPP